MTAEQQLKVSLTSMPDAMAVFDADERLVLCNELYIALFPMTGHLRRPGARLLDLTRAALIAGDLMNADSLTPETWLARKVSLARSGEPMETEFGPGRWIETRGRTERDGTTVLIYREVTDRKRLEADLDAAHQRLEDAVSSMGDGLVIYDADERLQSCNQAYLDLYPLTAHLRVPGILFTDVVEAAARNGELKPLPPASADQRRTSYLAVMHNNATLEKELADGRVIEVRTRPTGHGGTIMIHRDVTEHKRQAERFRQVVDAAPGAMFVVGADDRIELINRQAEHMFGYTPAELRGRSMDVVFPKRLQAEQAALRTATLTNQLLPTAGFQTDLFCLRKDGSEFPVEFKVSRIETRDGPILLSAIVDVTERREAEARLELNKKRNELVLQGLSVGIWDWNVITGELLWSARFREIVGISDQSFVPELASFSDRLHPDDHDQIMERLRQHIEEHVPYSVDYRLRRENGSYAWIHARGQAMWNEQGQVLRMVGSVADMSEHKLAEAALQDLAARLEAVFASAFDGIITFDEGGTIETVNPATGRIFGYDVVELTGAKLTLLMPDLLRDGLAGYLATGAGGEASPIIAISREIEGTHKDGSTFPIELNVGAVHADAGRYFTGFIRDLSEQRQTEARLHKIQGEFARVARHNAMGEMATTIAHEINQPLTAITNYLRGCRRLLDQVKPPLPTVMSGIVQAADQALRAGEIIRRLRDFISSGQSERTTESLTHLVVEASELALLGARDKGIQVRFAFATNHDYVLVDKVQIQQVLLNLIRNALESMEEQLDRRLVIATAISEDNLVEVCVADTGCGIPPELAERLFQPFVSTKQHGMGVGLSICRTIIESHGGKLWFKSEPMVGTVFHFTLQLVPHDQEAADLKERNEQETALMPQ